MAAMVWKNNPILPIVRSTVHSTLSSPTPTTPSIPIQNQSPKFYKVIASHKQHTANMITLILNTYTKPAGFISTLCSLKTVHGSLI